MISRIINKQNIIVAFRNSTQLNSTQLNSNLNSFKILASLFDVLNKLCHCEPNEVKAWQSRIKKVNFKNLVSLINEFYKKWIAHQRRTLVSDFSNPRNDDYILSTNNKNNKNYAFSYAFNFEIISRNKNLKSNYYGFLFNKQISLLKEE